VKRSKSLARLRTVSLEAQEQRCWNHRIVNALDQVPTTRQPQARLQLTQIPYAETAEDAERRKAGDPALVPDTGA